MRKKNWKCTVVKFNSTCEGWPWFKNVYYKP